MIIAQSFELLSSWLLTYLLHSTVLLLLVWGLSRFWSSYAVKELLWRVGLVGGFVTTSLTFILGGGFLFNNWSIFRNQPVETITSHDLAAPLIDGRPSVINETIEIQITITVFLLVAFTIWLIGAFFMLSRLRRNYKQIENQLSTRTSLQSSVLDTKLAELRQKAGIKANIGLSTSSDICCPLALGTNEICLPPYVLTNLTEYEQNSVLAHELAHLVRMDNLWRRFAAVLQAVFFFNPLYRLAFRELNVCAEFQCDRWAVKQTSSSLDLAKSLAKVANYIVIPPSPLTSTMAQDKRGLSDRVAHILKNPKQNRREIETGIGAVCCLLGLVLLLVPNFAGRPNDSNRYHFKIAKDQEVRQLEVALDKQMMALDSENQRIEQERLTELERLRRERDREIRQLELEFDRRIKELETENLRLEQERINEMDRLRSDRENKIRLFESSRDSF